MKKLTPLVLVAAFGAMMFTSCKKEYTCECTSTVDGVQMAKTDVSLGKQTKKDAKAACDDKSVESTAFGITSKVECSLK